MKRYFILTSVLALAACGGGSGTGDGVTGFERAAASNAVITGMVSRIQDNDSYNNLSRNATTRNSGTGANRATETVYLDNVLFESADKEFNNPDEDFKMRFHVDADGKIDGLDTIDDGESEVIARVGDENRFVKQDIDENGNVTADVVASVVLLGREKGLKYADFGFVKVDGLEYGETEADNVVTQFIMPIAGGYEAKNITQTMNAEDLDSDIVFNGIAVAGVGEPDTTVAGERLTLRDNNATLTFQKATGNEVFNANFADYTDSVTGVQYDAWYNVVATKYADGDAEIAFAAPTGRVIPAGFEAANSGKVANNNAEHLLSVGFNYYGDAANIPNEATGIISYECEGCQPFLMGFGGKAQ